MLVDLSDTTNWPHTDAGEVHLLGLKMNGETHTDGIFDLWVGVVTENDATDGSVSWLECFHSENQESATEDESRFDFQRDYTLGGYVPEGANLSVTSGALDNLVTNLTQADNSSWQNDTGLASPAGAAAGATGKPGVGDLVLWVEEVTNGGTLDLCVVAQYATA